MKKHVKIIGGLGNQLFQYTFGLYLCELGYEVVFDTSFIEKYKLHNGIEISKVLNLDENRDFVSSRNKLIHNFDNIFKYSLLNVFYYYNERPNLRFQFNKQVKYSRFKYYIGYWQSIEYVEKVSDLLLKQLDFKDISDTNLELSEKMNIEESVSIHIRRGDYVNSKYLFSLKREYYFNAISIMKKKLHQKGKVIHFYVFSNDIEWSQKIFSDLNIKITYVNWNQKEDSYQDMYLMSKCKHNIIANSTFSWWSAFFNTYTEKIVIVPRNWIIQKKHVGLYFENWIKV